MDKIIVTLPKKGDFHVQVIFQSEEFNNLDIYMNSKINLKMTQTLKNYHI